MTPKRIEELVYGICGDNSLIKGKVRAALKEAAGSGEAEGRNAVLEEAAACFSFQAEGMDMSFERRMLVTVADRIRSMKRPGRSHGESGK